MFANHKVFADEPAMPSSYQKIVSNNKYIFIMLASEPLMSSAGLRYHSSGLYKNNGSNRPIWTVDWYASTVYVSSDGKHLAKMGEWPSLNDKGIPDTQQLAVAFYENGELVKHYPISIVELVL